MLYSEGGCGSVDEEEVLMVFVEGLIVFVEYLTLPWWHRCEAAWVVEAGVVMKRWYI